MASVLWSLSAEWIMYLFFPFIFFRLLRLNAASHLLIIIISTFLISILPYIPNLSLNKHGISISNINDMPFNGFNAIIRCIASYFIGISLFELLKISRVQTIVKKINPIHLLIVIFILLALSTTLTPLILISFILLIGSCYLSDQKYALVKNGFLYKIGLYSYSIYIIHRAIKFILNNHIDDFNILNFSSITSTLIISYLTYTFIEKFFNKRIIKTLIN